MTDTEGKPFDPKIAAPLAIDAPFGEQIDFSDIVLSSDLPMVVSGSSAMPHVWLHDRDEHDYIVNREGLKPYCVISVRDLSVDAGGFREVVRRLAYGFNDYAALEVVERHNRDCERERRKRIMQEAAIRDRDEWQQVEDEHAAKIAAAVLHCKGVSHGVIGVDDPTERPLDADDDEEGFKP